MYLFPFGHSTAQAPDGADAFGPKALRRPGSMSSGFEDFDLLAF